jgi:hypothetical protein
MASTPPSGSVSAEGYQRPLFIRGSAVQLSATGSYALIVGADPFFYSRREQLVALAARHAAPAIYFQREFAAAGDLIPRMSFCQLGR